ncbi:hypothetical protein F4553_001150 [Allocatelliglobosispora scoriae]|uniref:Uncharacterized protein n=1 Tax=Allocatelliglobosispora scoriae TaxID=643052 RepID=A0A841BLN4_9ACTN|nr:hypothetical protein [Allocatelliglobosispora scoriae]MBB5867771.1 hypothetical protein [Allocatelliglobosispora scoriae]
MMPELFGRHADSVPVAVMCVGFAVSVRPGSNAALFIPRQLSCTVAAWAGAAVRPSDATTTAVIAARVLFIIVGSSPRGRRTLSAGDDVGGVDRADVVAVSTGGPVAPGPSLTLMVSVPSPPLAVSVPCRSVYESSPLPRLAVSLPAPPTTVSLPLPAVMVSLPPSPQITSLPVVPAMMSLPAVPTAVQPRALSTVVVAVAVLSAGSASPSW